MCRSTAPGQTGGEFKHLEQIAGVQCCQNFCLCITANPDRGRARGDVNEMRGIMGREDAIGEPHIGEIAADCFLARVELDRTPGQRESVTPRRTACWYCRRRRR